MIGKVIRDAYRIYDEIGRGSVAAVYLAKDLERNRVVALKVMHPELAQVKGVPIVQIKSGQGNTTDGAGKIAEAWKDGWRGGEFRAIRVAPGFRVHGGSATDKENGTDGGRQMSIELGRGGDSAYSALPPLRAPVVAVEGTTEGTERTQ
jgi:serine/threonine protein kinase